jgi:Asp-tRNA(Asn)/Glu-tRNA(Gln) amidotransferase A subunit family amidase
MLDWTPKVDATVATRVMDAGGVIVGKAGEDSTTELET